MNTVTSHSLLRALLTMCLLLIARAVHAQPANDAFVNAGALSGATAQASGNNVGATREPGEPQHAGVGGSASVWWRWTAPSTVRVVINTVGSNFDTVLAVYTGAAVNQLTAIASNDDTSGVASEVRFNAIAGTTYQIAVDGFLSGQNTASGTIALRLIAANPTPIITANPPPGTVNLPGAPLGELSRTSINLIATGGAPGTSAGIDCIGTGVLVGATGMVPTALRFTQTVAVGQQPVDLSIAAATTPAAQSLGLACTVDPSEGPDYTLSFSVIVPAGLAANDAPQISSVPPPGSRIDFPQSVRGTSPLTWLHFRAIPGTSGAGFVTLNCTAEAPLLILAPGSFLPTSQVSFRFAGDVSDLTISAPVRSTAYASALRCTALPSSGPSYALNYTVAVPAGIEPGSQRWEAQGPASAIGGQSENIAGPLPNAVSGAVHVVLPHPGDANVLTIGAVNGGIWRTQNALADAPQWRARTDHLGSLSIGALVYDHSDAASRRMFAGVGRFSSYRSDGGARIGVLRSLDAGETWSVVSSNMAGRNISGLHANGEVVVAAVNAANSGSCSDYGLFRSLDAGSTFVQLGAGQGLPGGLSTALASHASAPERLFAHIDGAERCGSSSSANGIYRSVDNGATWARVGNADMNTQLAITGKLVRLQAVVGGNVVAAVSDARLQGVFASSDGGSSWASLGIPQTMEGSEAIGIHPGGQGRLHLSVAIDPANPNWVFVGGDRQPVGGNGNFPNSISARGFTGRLFRRDRSGGEWMPLTHNGTGDNSSPHADSRSMAFDAAGRLIEGDDGGVYARLNPASSSGRWITLNGDLQVSEQHSLAVDGLSGVAMTGNQDNGTMRQDNIGQRLWRVISGGDGGDTAIDALQRDLQSESVGYTSSQNLGGFRRRTYNGETPVAVVLAELESVGGGDAVTGQFVTPIAANRAVGHRLVIGGDNGVFESFDSGDTVQVIGEGIRARAVVSSASIAYGATNNVDALYVAGCRGNSCTDGDDGVFVRQVLGTPLTLARANTAPRVAHAVTINGRRAEHAFAIAADSSVTRAGGQAILETIDFGATWQDVTGNLPSEAGLVRSLLHIHSGQGDMLIAGTNVGVYLAPATQAYRNWTRLGEGLPNAPVYELDYDQRRNRLIAASLGRGSYSLSAPGLRANPGWSGLWFDPAVDGQGFQFDVIPEQDVLVVAWYTHLPGSSGSNLVWLTGAGTLSNGVAEVSVSRSRGRFDAANANLAHAGGLRVRFDDCGRARVEYSVTLGAGSRTGQIALQRLSPDALCQAFRIQGASAALPAPSGRFQVGLNGTWFNPATNGQGMLIEYLPDRQQLVVGWYAYEFGEAGVEQPPLWLTAIGPVSGSSATLPVTLTRGGDFVSATPPVTRTQVGTLTIEVVNCTSLTAQYSLTIDGVQRSGTIPLQRTTFAGLCRESP